MTSAANRGELDSQLRALGDLFEIELSSLDLAQVFEEIEQRFSVDLEITDLFDYPTVNDLARYLAEQVVDA